MEEEHLAVDQYGPIDLLSYSALSCDHSAHSADVAELIWHGVLLNPRAPPGQPLSMDAVRGVTLNQLLLIYFTLYGREEGGPGKDSLLLPGRAA